MPCDYKYLTTFLMILFEGQYVEELKSFIDQTQGRRKVDNWGGADIHIFMFTDCKNNRFQRK